MFVPGKLVQPSLMFVDKARSLPLSGAPERCLIHNTSFSWYLTFGPIKLVFVPGKPFQLNLMFAGNADAYHSSAGFWLYPQTLD